MPQDPIVDKIVAALMPYTENRRPGETDLEVMQTIVSCAVTALDVWARSRGLISPEPPSGREFNKAREILGMILDRPDIGIWRSRDDRGWEAMVTKSKGAYSSTCLLATVTDAEVADAIAKEDAGNAA